jgi:imidazole glycerol-phosphate synthase subunit HisH
MIGIINYGAGNIKSLSFALDELGIKYCISDDIDVLKKQDKLILPGVGHAGFAMNKLEEKKLTSFIKECKQELLGICLGMQLLFESSEETDKKLIGIIPAGVKRFQAKPHTHMGWNKSANEYYYFVHQYYGELNDYTVEISEYNHVKFSSVIKKDNFIAVQFHPEKSAASGLKLLDNFYKGKL